MDRGVPSESLPSALRIDEFGRSLPSQREIKLEGIGLHAGLDHVQWTDVGVKIIAKEKQRYIDHESDTCLI